MVDRTGTPLVELRDISIAFGGIKAVDCPRHHPVAIGLIPRGHLGQRRSLFIRQFAQVHLEAEMALGCDPCAGRHGQNAARGVAMARADMAAGDRKRQEQRRIMLHPEPLQRVIAVGQPDATAAGQDARVDSSPARRAAFEFHLGMGRAQPRVRRRIRAAHFRGHGDFLGQLADLNRIDRQGETLRIGAGVTIEALLQAMIPLHPSFAEMLRRYASLQVRNAATIGGNIANGSPIGDGPPPLIAMGATVQAFDPEGMKEAAHLLDGVVFKDGPYDAVEGADAVINLVGLLYESGRQTFQAVHVDAARTIAQAAAQS